MRWGEKPRTKSVLALVLCIFASPDFDRHFSFPSLVTALNHRGWRFNGGFKIFCFLQIVHDSKEIQQLNTDKARLIHEVERLMQTVEHLESTMTESGQEHTSEVNLNADFSGF